MIYWLLKVFFVFRSRFGVFEFECMMVLLLVF